MHSSTPYSGEPIFWRMAGRTLPGLVLSWRLAWRSVTGSGAGCDAPGAPDERAGQLRRGVGARSLSANADDPRAGGGCCPEVVMGGWLPIGGGFRPSLSAFNDSQRGLYT